jgi:lipid A 3-O-deacylase
MESFMKKLVALAGMLLGLQVPLAHAADTDTDAGAITAAPWWEQGRWSLQTGIGDGNNRVTINRETGPVWQHSFGSTRIELVGELGASYWWTTQSNVLPGYANHEYQLSAIPLFRYWATQRFYVEGGVGATFFSDTKFHDKNISTAFQFGDHIGAGYQLTRSTRVGLRVSHFSNASIKRPNPGLNIVQLQVSTTF